MAVGMDKKTNVNLGNTIKIIISIAIMMGVITLIILVSGKIEPVCTSYQVLTYECFKQSMIQSSFFVLILISIIVSLTRSLKNDEEN